jgi:hypothetical protein
MTPVILLITDLGSTAAHADTITEIDGVQIGSTVYDVTFSTTDNGTFATDSTDASTAAQDLLDDLNSDYLVTGVCEAGGTGCVGDLFLNDGKGGTTTIRTMRPAFVDAHRRRRLAAIGPTPPK